MRSLLLILISALPLYSFAQVGTNGLGKCTIYTRLGIQGGGPLYQSESVVSKKGSVGFSPLAGMGIRYSLFKRKNSMNLSFETFYSRRKINYQSGVKDQYYVDQQTIYIGSDPIVFDVETTFTGDTEGYFDMHYLEFPLQIQYGIKERWVLQAGAYYSWAFHAENKGKATGIVGRTDVPDPSTIENREYDNSTHLNTRYWGVVAGAQYKVNDKLSVDLRMTYSFRSLYDTDWKGVDYTLKDLYAQVSVNYNLFHFNP